MMSGTSRPTDRYADRTRDAELFGHWKVLIIFRKWPNGSSEDSSEMWNN